jgi:hypothetical protein
MREPVSKDVAASEAVSVALSILANVVASMAGNAAASMAAYLRPGVNSLTSPLYVNAATLEMQAHGSAPLPLQGTMWRYIVIWFYTVAAADLFYLNAPLSASRAIYMRFVAAPLLGCMVLILFLLSLGILGYYVQICLAYVIAIQSLKRH